MSEQEDGARHFDANMLRNAAAVIRRRRKRSTFMSDVLIRALENMARRMEAEDG
jgi:hypothetical protein